MTIESDLRSKTIILMRREEKKYIGKRFGIKKKKEWEKEEWRRSKFGREEKKTAV